VATNFSVKIDEIGLFN